LIRLLFDPVDGVEWSRRLDIMPESNLLQTWAYGEAKAQTGTWKVERAVIVEEKREFGLVQMFIKKIPLIGGGLVWINRGPLLCEPARSDFRKWHEVLEALRLHWVEERRMLLRVALPHREMIDLAQVVPRGFRLAESGAGAHSARLDLFQPLESLRRQLDQKWRNGLNKAERANTNVESGADEDLFSAVIADYSTMIARKKFATSVTPELLEQLQRALSPQQKLWNVISREEDNLAGFVLIVRYGQTAEYLAGSSSASGRTRNVGNLLLWRAITEMKEQGYRWFDLGGMDPDRTPSGIYHFKAGVGATAYRLPDEIEAYRHGFRSFAVRRAIRRARTSAAQ
jgi:lipid II:glycine glycyltransferase (peptidoglycan interpeptide bridge formation enzyme)